MNPTVALIVTILIVFVGFLLFAFFAYRSVVWAKRRRTGSEFAGGLPSLGSALNPAEAVVEEKQRVKRSDEGSGDPEKQPDS